MKYGLLIILISAFFYFVQILLFFRNKIDFRQLGFMLLSIFFLCFIYDTGSEFKSHGSYNRVILFLFIMFFSIFYMLGLYLLQLIQQYPKVIISSLLIILFMIGLKVKIAFDRSCYNWLDGFQNSKMDNRYGPCIIPPPKTCYFELFDGFFDLTKLFGETCENTPYNNPQNTLMNLSPKLQKAKILGYPRSENWKLFPDCIYGNIQKIAMEQMVDMEDPLVPQEVKDKIEVTVNYKLKKPEVKIDLKRDNELAIKRTKIFDKYRNRVHYKNVLYVFIDSLSRVNFRRKLPKLYKWMENKYHGK